MFRLAFFLGLFCVTAFVLLRPHFAHVYMPGNSCMLSPRPAPYRVYWYYP